MAEKQKTQYVTIPLEEYKMLLLKEQPKSNIKEKLLEDLYNTLCCAVEYSKREYSSSYIKDNMEFSIDGLSQNIVDFFRNLKYADIDAYMELWNKVQTNHRKEEEMKMKTEQMNQAKEIRNNDN